MKGAINLQELQHVIATAGAELEKRIGRPLSEDERWLLTTHTHLALCDRKLAELEAKREKLIRDHERDMQIAAAPLNDAEATAFKALLDEFWKRTGMDPTTAEHLKMLGTARVMAGQGVDIVQ
jgi:hypothetical protein